MKKRFLSILIAASTIAHAGEATEVVLDSEIKDTEYTATIIGSPNCKMPVNLGTPKKGDCEIKKGSFQTGWKLVKVGDTCYRDEMRLVDFNKMRTGEKATDLPNISSNRKEVKCPV
ncbi:hypothetical protein [Methylophilus sp. QUAN]|uniref:hypothetical protein n=1 Tax=Methylophilus sp. QUAN TaxID=2781020 RepID=UPI001890534A|nr:hypothetical protein [Methylophilus sp. QUAN]MBF4991116.1 hypothetical protein [Methylophilus sp. QUAN]